jgi:endonuclease YncB( thermonuclease family)
VRNLLSKWLVGLCGLLLCFSLSAAEIIGKVIAVSDGDTITVLAPGNRPTKVRLAGIDAPERAQPFGQKSRQHLADLVFGKEVRVSVVDKDRYGRIVGIVYVPKPIPNGEIIIDVDLAQIESGHAWAYRDYLRGLPAGKAGRYVAAEKDAKEKRQGLWTDKSPEPPWQYRKEQRNKRQ